MRSSSHRSHTRISHRASNAHRSSSLSHRSSSLSHRSSLSHHKSIRRRSISNAHAFAVGKSTGVNINGSAMGAHGAALGRFKRMRRNMHTSSTNRSTFSKRRLRFSSSFKSKRYTLNKDLNYINKQFENANYSRTFMFIIFFIVLAFMLIIPFIFFFISLRMFNI